MLPFTVAQFFDVFARYNDAIWPAQIIAYLVGVAALAFLVRRGRQADLVTTACLAGMWLWTGIAYHWLFFAAINDAALVFGAIFIAQALLLLYEGLVRKRLRFGFDGSPAALVGLVFVFYAAVLYPIIGISTGHEYPRLPTFGLTPCPVTIFTLGLLLLTVSPVPASTWIVPALWSLIGGTAAFLLDVPQDWALLFSGFLAIPLIVLRDRGRRASSPGSRMSSKTSKLD